MGSPKFNYDKMTKEEILEVFKQNYLRIKPKDAADFYKKGGSPSFYALRKYVGLTYAQTLVKLGLKNEKFGLRYESKLKSIMESKLKNKDELLEIKKNDFLTLYEELGRIPTTTEIIKRYGCKFSKNKLKNTHNMTYREFVKWCGLDNSEVNDNLNNDDISEKDLINEYLELCKKLGKTATIRELEKYTKYNYQNFNRKFSGITELRLQIGIDISNLGNNTIKKYNKNKIIELLKIDYIKYGKIEIKDLIDKHSYDDLFPRSITTLFSYLEINHAKELWEIVEKELLNDYIKEKRRVKGEGNE